MARFVAVRPNTELRFAFDWSAFLPDGVTVTGYSWSIDPDDVSPSMIDEADAETAVVSGFAAGRKYRLSCRATLSNGEVGADEVTLGCEKG